MTADRLERMSMIPSFPRRSAYSAWTPRVARDLLLALVVVSAFASSRAEDWPRLGGPAGIGVSPETNLARTWPAEGPRVLWTAEVGEGFGGAAIQAGQVFLLDRVGTQRDVLRCLDLETGAEAWRAVEEAPGRLPYDGSRNVPTVDERFVFAVSPFGQLRAYDRAARKPLWSRHLVDDFKDPRFDPGTPAEDRAHQLLRSQLPMWGLTQAPLRYRDTVILAPQTQTTGLVAFEEGTGKIRWHTGYLGRNWYSHVSPCLARFGGVDQVVMLAQPSDPEKSPAKAPPALISSFNAATGELLWTNVTPRPYKIPISQPLPLPGDRLFITGGYGLGCLVYRVTSSAQGWQSDLVQQTQAAAAHIHSPVLYRDRVYVMSFKEHGGKATGLVCLNLDGQEVWATGPQVQFDSGALLIADGMAFVMHGKKGELSLFELGDEGPLLLAKAKVLDADGGNVWAPMALSRGRLIVRDQHSMKCLDVRAR